MTHNVRYQGWRSVESSCNPPMWPQSCTQSLLAFCSVGVALLTKQPEDSVNEIDVLMGWSGAFVLAGKSTVKSKAKSNPVPENVVTIDQFRYIKIHNSAARLGGNKTKEII